MGKQRGPGRAGVHRLLVALITAGMLAGCQREEPELPIQTIPDSAVLAAFGQLEDSTGSRIVQSVRDATLSPSGRHLVIGDGVPPYLRIVDLDSDSVVMWGRWGGAPDEMGLFLSADFLSDSVIVVMAAGSVHHVRVDGTWMSGRRTRAAGVHFGALTIACGAQFYGYGMQPSARQRDPLPWIFRLSVPSSPDSAPTVVPVLELPGVYRGYGTGQLVGLDGNDNGILYWHRAHPTTHTGYWIDCGDYSTESWDTVPQASPALAVGARGIGLTLPDSMFKGAVVRDRAFLRAYTWEVDDRPITHIEVVEPDGCREIKLAGDWKLQDGHARGVVLSRLDPFPRAVLVDWAWMDDALVAADCSIGGPL